MSEISTFYKQLELRLGTYIGAEQRNLGIFNHNLSRSHLKFKNYEEY